MFNVESFKFCRRKVYWVSISEYTESVKLLRFHNTCILLAFSEYYQYYLLVIFFSSYLKVQLSTFEKSQAKYISIYYKWLWERRSHKQRLEICGKLAINLICLVPWCIENHATLTLFVVPLWRIWVMI